MTFSVKDILKIEVAPALGCTEPVAIALGAAAAASILPNDKIEEIEIWVDPNIYKNGLAAVIPVSSGLTGLEMASVLGAFGGDPELGLEVLKPVKDDAVGVSKKFIEAGKVKVNLIDDTGLYIKTVIKNGSNVAESVIKGVHDNICSLTLNGNDIKDSPILSGKSSGRDNSNLPELEAWLKKKSLADLLELIDYFDEEDLKFLEEGVTYNMRLAEYGLKHGPGLGIGKALDRLIRQKILTLDMMMAARKFTSAAADARMGGVKLPAMSSAGSGNHGLTAILPIWAIREFVEHDKETVLRAIGFSHIITAYVKAHTGRLSAICGCSVAAGAGATAGVTYLLGGDVHHIAGAIKNLTEDLAGVICDGAKPGCALKLTTAASASVQAALFSLHGVRVEATDGIIASSPEKTIENIGKLSTHGMIETDRTILKIMIDKKFSD